MHLAPRPRVLAAAALTAVLVPLVGTGPALADDAPAVGDTVVGELVQAWAEHADPEEAAEHAEDALLSWVTEADGTSVRVDTGDVDDVPVGATVEVTLGEEVPAEPGAPAGAEPVHEVLDAEVVAPAEAAPVAPASAPYTNEVTVVLVAPKGTSPDATTVQQVVDEVNGPVADFWETQSDGAVRIHATAGRETWVSTTAVCDTSSAMWTAVAGEIGWTAGPGRHLLLYVPGYPAGMPSCAYGLAQVGSAPGGGGSLYVRGVRTSVIAHELGHNFGLGHASAVQCDGAVETGTCRTVSYGDWYDVMGVSWNEVGSLNAPHAARLGFLPSSATASSTAADQGGSWWLSPLGGRSGTRVLSLVGNDGVRYWLEYRAAVGQDAWLDPGTGYGFEPGVLVHVDGPGPRSDTSVLLDATPSAQAGWDADEQTVLPAGGEVTVGGLAIRVSSATATGAAVSVLRGVPVPSADSPITVLHRDLGGDGGRLGAPVGPEQCDLRDGGCARSFVGGVVTWSPATGARVLEGAILQQWIHADGLAGVMGYPVGDMVCGLVRGGCGQQFQGGSIYWSPATGAHAVTGGIRGYWAGTGWEWGWLGYATGDMSCVDGRCTQYFEGGVVAWTAVTGTHGTGGAIAQRWFVTWHSQGIGMPTTEMVCGLPRGGCGQQFQGGSIYWSPATGAQAVSGAIRGYWTGQGWERGPLGYPRSDMTCTDGYCLQAFEGGRVTWSGATGTHGLFGGIGEYWFFRRTTQGLGLPTTEMWCGMVRGGCGQHFAADSSVYWSPGTGTNAVGGAIRGAWAGLGWETGRLGYPVSTMTCRSECAQSFEGGRVTWSPWAGTQVVLTR
ncbi:reprolysin-like metallopeptidase [Geodermatophilus sp. SYSU D01045]